LPFATSGEVSLGPMIRRQRTVPLRASSATTSPSIPGVEGAALQASFPLRRLFRNAM
jgi:hypothetical protein